MVSNDFDGAGLNVFKVFCISGVSWPFHTDEVLPEVLSKDCTLSGNVTMCTGSSYKTLLRIEGGLLRE
jgi:hypothetical protein